MLVAGGSDGFYDYISSAELYDPATGKWTLTGHLGVGRGGHDATLLPNGQVLVSGGVTFGSPDTIVLNTAELYDPAAGQWTPTGSMSTPRIGHSATLLPSGLVLAAAGYGFFEYLHTAELYDPATGVWTATGSLKRERLGHTATLFPSGKVLAVGGYTIGMTLRSTEVYTPDAGAGSP